ncbi:MAG: DoxX family membrane protein [Planctomycetes bacterium]|nr:DoxX family membrane protein [Planctomycetota bacterium]
MIDAQDNSWGWMWATFTVRWVLGFIFLMAGWMKCFSMGPRAHAERFFLSETFRESWIPEWLLWAAGTATPVVELIAGAMVCLGLGKRIAYIALAAILVMVTYGHLLENALYDTTSHIFPRLTLLVFVMAAPRRYDVLSVDHLIAFLRR